MKTSSLRELVATFRERLQCCHQNRTHLAMKFESRNRYRPSTVTLFPQSLGDPIRNFPSHEFGNQDEDISESPTMVGLMVSWAYTKLLTPCSTQNTLGSHLIIIMRTFISFLLLIPYFPNAIRPMITLSLSLIPDSAVFRARIGLSLYTMRAGQ